MRSILDQASTSVLPLGVSCARRAAGLGLALGMLVPLSRAQWIATSLHPVGAQAFTFANGGDAGGQAGSSVEHPYPNNFQHACMWNGTAGSFVDLHPPGSTLSEALDSRAGVQVGWANVGGVRQAAMWNGSAASYVNLNPAGSTESYVYGCSGSDQAGLAVFGGAAHAGLWHGSAGSFIDLSPAGAGSSVVWAMRGVQQVGQASTVQGTHAGIWLGNPNSWLDLHPTGATNSRAFGTDGVQQVGSANIGPDIRASLWNGTAASWVDLTPFSGGISEVRGVDAGEQAGWCGAPFGSPEAYFWAGSASTAFRLQVALPPNYGTSKASAIWHSGGHTYVFGTAQNLSAGHDEAILWERFHMTTYCTAKLNSVGCVPSISGTGTSSATNASVFQVRSINMQNNKPGLLLYSNSGRAASPFGGGTLCVNGPLRRVQGLNSGGQPVGNNCSGIFSVDMNAFRAGTLGGNPAAYLSVPGNMINCQFWGRDSGFVAPNNTQLSDALEFEVGP